MNEPLAVTLPGPHGGCTELIWTRAIGSTGQVRPFVVELLTFSRDWLPFPIWALPVVWLGPAVVAAWATSWISGRRGEGFGRGAGIGIAAAVAVGIFGCVTPIVALSPLAGAVVAVIAVLRAG